jgi:hypothetical protein
MRPLLIVATVIVLLAVGWLGWAYYAYRKLAPVLSKPGVGLVATKFVAVPVKDIRRVSLGYGVVSLPESVAGEPVVLNNNMVGISADKPGYPIFFMAPVREKSAGADLIKPLEQLTGKPVGNWFEVQKIVFSAQPFTFVEMLMMGRQRIAATTLLLTVKSMGNNDVAAVQIAEADGIGAVILFNSRGALVQIFVQRHGTVQTMFVDKAMIGKLPEIVSAVISDYDLRLEDDSEVAIQKLIEKAGIRSAPPREATEPAALTPAR